MEIDCDCGYSTSHRLFLPHVAKEGSLDYPSNVHVIKMINVIDQLVLVGISEEEANVVNLISYHH